MKGMPISEKAQDFEPPERWVILLVDTESTQRLITSRLLRRAGFDVATASNGREALLKLESGNFQIMITEWEMPEMDGIALCRAVRSADLEGYVYTIVLSSRDAIEHLVVGLSAGADDYLTKPVLEPELLARLSTGKRIVMLQRSLHTANEEHRRLAYRHPLTEVLNRLHLMEQLPRELHQAHRDKRPLSLIMLDIDNFKHVNDTHGHAAGSHVLQAVANLLNAKADEAGGWFVHHGGDEFAIVLPNVVPSAAATFADILRIALSAEHVLGGNADVRITASFGVSGWTRAVPRLATADDLLRLADRCVYESKSSGRNRVSVKALTRSNTRT